MAPLLAFGFLNVFQHAQYEDTVSLAVACAYDSYVYESLINTLKPPFHILLGFPPLHRRVDIFITVFFRGLIKGYKIHDTILLARKVGFVICVYMPSASTGLVLLRTNEYGIRNRT